MNKIKSVLVANRGEIAIRVFRACSELGIRTVAIYSKEDTLSLHRNKADEAYLIGEEKGPIEAYLDIEGILKIAKEHEVDAIHPGYGFLSENSVLAKRCKEEGFVFIGPKLEHLIMFGDKINARKQAELANIPMIPGSDGPVKDLAEVKFFVDTYGYPIILKAIMGGGGRGMRIVRDGASLEEAFERAKSEALASFGCDEIYVEKLLVNPKHIEVQVIGDHHGNLVHLYERDCSVQRRHQKLVEMAPSLSLSVETRHEICNAAVKLMKNVNYVSVGTVEFLVVPDGSFYFIEVNPRIQVEHTITEMITGIDIVQSQILVAQGHKLHAQVVGIPAQDKINCNGHAIQCRVTTEDPSDNFRPDTGKLMAYRSGGGFGIRLDGCNAFNGSVITPYYDSLLVKATTWGLTHNIASAKMLRCLAEFRIRGVKTNIQFLENVIKHEQFIKGTCNTCFVDQSPELFVFAKQQDRGTKLLSYIGETIVNGYDGKGSQEKLDYKIPSVPKLDAVVMHNGTKQILDAQGPAGLVKWIKAQEKVLLTDTTFRDAHQSLLATRMRTYDMLKVTEPTAAMLYNLFSLEMWGGATFDVAYRFLNENPWKRLADMRIKAPNILFQMLLRGANAVGYTSYPDNVVREFVRLAAKNGIDVFRIFDSLNSLDNMSVAIDAVREQDKIAEVTMCYTGDILDTSRVKYDLKYYINMAKDLRNAGAHILAIKDMSGILKPEAAYRLISTLKDSIDIPIHLHTHEGTGNSLYMYARAIDAGVDIVDVTLSAMAGGTSQPAANSLYYALAGHKRQPELDIRAADELSHYWEDVRTYYRDVDTTDRYPNPEVYIHEMPGGQYTNFKQQAVALGLQDRWEELKNMYARVNMLFGDIVKVTPSSKIVGDMALFMVQNDLSEEDIYTKGHTLDFPNSVIEFFQGRIGMPYQGFPKELQNIILRGKQPLIERPGKNLSPINFSTLKTELEDSLDNDISDEDVIAYALYPKVFSDWAKLSKEYGDTSILDTPTFFFGLKPDEVINVDIEKGKTLVIKLIHIGNANDDGMRIVSFELNGLAREILIKDRSIKTTNIKRKKADKECPGHVGATLSGTVVKVIGEKGTRVAKGAPLIVTEAMKMETTIQAPISGVIVEIHVRNGSRIDSGDCLIEIE